MSKVVFSELDCIEGSEIYLSDNVRLVSNISGDVVLPSGTDLERPEDAISGEFRFNTDKKQIEYYNGSAWVSLATEDDTYKLSKSGLIAAFDVSNSSSYSGNSTTLSNLAKVFTINGSLVNSSPTVNNTENFRYFDFNGSSNYIEISDSIFEEFFDGSSYSLSIWFKSNSSLNFGTSNNNKILFSMNGDPNLNILRIGVVPSGGGIFYSDNTSGDVVVNSGTNYNNDTWNNLVITRPEGNSGLTSTVYINGSSIGTITNTNPSYSLASVCSIGQSFNPDLLTTSNFYGGSFSILNLYDRELTSQEVLDLYNIFSYRY